MPEPESKTVQAGDLDIHYLELGSGPPMLLLHGGSATAASSWDVPFATLTSRWRLVAPDSRAHGKTANPADQLAYDQMADDAAALTEALRLERPVIVGYSDGGQIALEFALRHPGKARAVVLGGTMSQSTKGYLEVLHQWGIRTPGAYDAVALKAAFGGYYDVLGKIHGDGDPTYLDRLLKQLATLWLNVPFYSEAQLRSVVDPVLIIAGDRDELTGFDQQERLYRNIPHAELGIVPGASHGTAAGRLFWAMVEDFLQRTVTQPG